MLFVGCFMLYFDVVTYVETLDSIDIKVRSIRTEYLH